MVFQFSLDRFFRRRRRVENLSNIYSPSEFVQMPEAWAPRQDTIDQDALEQYRRALIARQQQQRPAFMEPSVPRLNAPAQQQKPRFMK